MQFFLQRRFLRYRSRVQIVFLLFVIQSLPFLEYELHKQLVNKLKVKGMNSLFRLKIQIGVGLTQLVAVAVGNNLNVAFDSCFVSTFYH